MKILLNYNFNPSDIIGNNFAEIFERKRRDSCFIFVYKENNNIYAIRDHLGIVPLYFRFKENENLVFSTNLNFLVDSDCRIDLEGLKYFLAFKTPRIKSLFKGINIVPPGTVMKIDVITKVIKIVYQYKINLPKKFSGLSLSEYVDILDELFMQAIKRIYRFDKIGLYLSGGVDSALTGIYLKKMGARINAYTSAPWGRKSSEIPFAKINAEKIGVESHKIVPLESKQYQGIISYIPELYKFPHGTTGSIGVTSLWKNSQIKNEKQIYGAQNCDTVTCSMFSQYIQYFLRFLPKFIRRKLHKNIKYKDILQNYISFSTHGLVHEYEDLRKYLDPQSSTITLLSLAGMYLIHTPSDGEELSGPVISHNILFSDPFYDIDLIEFFLSVPLKFRIAFSKDSKTKIVLDKVIFRKLAERYLPKDLVYRKKGLTVSFDRDEYTQKLVKSFPRNIKGFSLSDNEMRFSAKMISDWCRSVGVKL